MRCIYADPDNLNKSNKSDSGLLAQMYLQLSKSGRKLSLKSLSGYGQVQEVFGQGSISVGALLFSGSRLSTGILGKSGMFDVHRAGGEPSPAWA
jgi:hypothetical protein